MTARCEECGFDRELDEPAELVEQLYKFPTRYRVPLTRFLPGEDPDVVIRTRPDPAVWSVLEYAAHTRDALAFYSDRIERVLREDRPQLAALDFDALCTERRYNEDDPAAVIDTLASVATSLADRLSAIDAADWQRVGIGSDGDERTVLVLARRAVHEGQHHLLDIGRAARHARGR